MCHLSESETAFVVGCRKGKSADAKVLPVEFGLLNFMALASLQKQSVGLKQ